MCDHSILSWIDYQDTDLDGFTPYLLSISQERHVLFPPSSSAPSSYDVIMFDVDSKDSVLGMSCPPSAFVEKSFLLKVKDLLQSEGEKGAHGPSASVHTGTREKRSLSLSVSGMTHVYLVTLFWVESVHFDSPAWIRILKLQRQLFSSPRGFRNTLRKVRLVLYRVLEILKGLEEGIS